jgi:DNA-binding transcriptional regulator YiaG
MLERLCSEVLPEYVDDTVSADIVGRKILWQMGMIAWNIVVTGREELAEGAFAGSKLNDEQRVTVRREIDGLTDRMRCLYPRVTHTIRTVSVVFKKGVPHAKVQTGEEFPPALNAGEKSQREVMTGEKILALRKQLKLTQIQFGEKIGVSARKVSAWEHDRSRPSEVESAKIASLAKTVVNSGELS